MTPNAPITKFNLRIYGLFINEQHELLLSDEEFMGKRMTKFPGGGLQPGEGTIDCLKREALEEFGQEIEVLEHYYTTDFFQKALFFEDQQLISIYYKTAFKEAIRFPIATQPFDFKSAQNELLSFRLRKLSELQPEELTFPIDRFVLRLLKGLQIRD